MPLQMIGVSLTGSFPQGVPAIAELMDNVRRVERLGFDAIWSGDHIIMHSPIMDVMTVLASFAAITERVHIGTAVYLLPFGTPWPRPNKWHRWMYYPVDALSLESVLAGRSRGNLRPSVCRCPSVAVAQTRDWRS